MNTSSLRAVHETEYVTFLSQFQPLQCLVISLWCIWVNWENFYKQAIYEVFDQQWNEANEDNKQRSKR